MLPLAFVFQVIKDYQLMALIFVLVLFDVLVLTVWEFVSPLAIVVYNSTQENAVRGRTLSRDRDLAT